MNLKTAIPLVSLSVFGCGGAETQAPAQPDVLSTAPQGGRGEREHRLPDGLQRELREPAHRERAVRGRLAGPHLLHEDADVLAGRLHRPPDERRRAWRRILAKYMEDNLPGLYSSIVAEANPDQMNSPCGPAKDYQTNAIIYRTGRLEPISGTKVTWQVYKGANGSCVMNTQSRSIGVRMAFRDLITGKTGRHRLVALAHQSGRPVLGLRDAPRRTSSSRTRRWGVSGANLLIWGVDSNEGDYGSNGYKDWYKRRERAALPAPSNYNWKDPIYEALRRRPGPASMTTGRAARVAASTSSSTTRGRARRRAHTITYNEGDEADLQFTGADRDDLNYSGYRAAERPHPVLRRAPRVRGPGRPVVPPAGQRAGRAAWTSARPARAP